MIMMWHFLYIHTHLAIVCVPNLSAIQSQLTNNALLFWSEISVRRQDISVSRIEKLPIPLCRNSARCIHETWFIDDSE
ncbi:hypothetical protein F5Y08DRAFT_310704 [Xylaria arbuscula]|nr:hypothetical protein F5Y08DRAFT_310704 [Xylaria arbuscula]